MRGERWKNPRHFHGIFHGMSITAKTTDVWLEAKEDLIQRPIVLVQCCHTQKYRIVDYVQAKYPPWTFLASYRHGVLFHVLEDLINVDEVIHKVREIVDIHV
jgi:hypothetical protein